MCNSCFIHLFITLFPGLLSNVLFFLHFQSRVPHAVKFIIYSTSPPSLAVCVGAEWYVSEAGGMP